MILIISNSTSPRIENPSMKQVGRGLKAARVLNLRCTFLDAVTGVRCRILDSEHQTEDELILTLVPDHGKVEATTPFTLSDAAALRWEITIGAPEHPETAAWAEVLERFLREDKRAVDGAQVPLAEHAQHTAGEFAFTKDQRALFCHEVRNALVPVLFRVTTRLEAAGLSPEETDNLLFGLRRLLAVADVAARLP